MKISVLPGDGIGPEIVNQAIKILELFKLDKDLVQNKIGGIAFEEFGDPLPKSRLLSA